jgi:hypothetical protein
MCLTILEKSYHPYVDFTQKRYKIFQSCGEDLLNLNASTWIGDYYFSVGEELDCTIDIKGNKFNKTMIISSDNKEYQAGFHSYLTPNGLFQMHRNFLINEILYNHKLFAIYEVEASQILARGCERLECSALLPNYGTLHTVTVSKKIKLIRKILPDELKKFM